MSEIKKVIFNKPATIVFWDDNTKTVVKASKSDGFSAETGLAMAITKKICNNIHWKNIFYIITTDDEVKGKVNKIKFGDYETIALMYVQRFYHFKPDWYKEFKKWLPKVEVAPNADWTETNPESPAYISNSPKLNADDSIIEMFNAGCSINKISKETGMSKYYVKKYIDTATAPKTNHNKVNRILKKAIKAQDKPKRGYVRRTQIDFPDYLDKATCEQLLSDTKKRFQNDKKINCLSELQRRFNRACKCEYIKTHYGNGYDMCAIAKTLGTNASAVQKIWNEIKRGNTNDNK